MSTIESLEHSLTVVHDLGVKADDSLESKKEEVKIAAGGAIAASELVKIHEEFIEKSKKDLEEKVKEGKLTAEFVKSAMNISKLSHDVVKKFLNDKTALYNIRRGEALALETTVKTLKETHDKLATDKRAIEESRRAAAEARALEKELQLKQQAEAAEQAAKEEKTNKEEKLETSKPTPGRKRRRPDEAPHVKDTVERLKQSRKSKRTNQ
jgi:hypothetical protein